MSAVDRLAARQKSSERGLGLSGAWHAIVATNAASINDRIMVTIPEFSTRLRFGPCRWQAREDVTALPQRGDTALVLFSSKKEPWVVAWWPFS